MPRRELPRGPQENGGGSFQLHVGIREDFLAAAAPVLSRRSHRPHRQHLPTPRLLPGAAAQSGTPGTLRYRRRSRPAAPLAHAPRETPHLRGWRWRTRGLVSTTHGFDKTAQSSQPRAPLNGWNEKTRRRMERDGSQRRPGQDHGPK